MDKIIVGLIVFAAIGLLAGLVFRSLKSGGSCPGGCSCANKKSENRR